MSAHEGEPPNSDTPTPAESNTPPPQIITPQDTPPETVLLEQQNLFLTQRIEELEADRAERKAREQNWQAERTQLNYLVSETTSHRFFSLAPFVHVQL